MSKALGVRPAERHGREITRWLLSGAFVAGVHIAAAFAFLHAPTAEETSETSGAFVVELAPMAVARQEVPQDVTPGPDQQQADAAPPKVERTDQPPEEPPPPEQPLDKAEVSLPAPLPKRDEPPEEQPAPQTPVAATTATQVEAERAAATAAAPVAGAPRLRDTKAVSNWQAKVVTVLERNKRYPAGAQSRGEQGTVQISFTIDRQGRLLASRVARTSGAPLLDAEAQALLQRAQPFPVPPGDVPGQEIALTVPIRFNFR